jgi:hypothetical protein
MEKKTFHKRKQGRERSTSTEAKCCGRVQSISALRELRAGIFFFESLENVGTGWRRLPFLI